MFGFIKRRMRREHSKLLYQNGAAAKVNRLFLEEIGEIQAAEDAEKIVSLVRTTSARRKNGLLEPDDFEAMFELNRELRRIHDASAIGIVQSFDERYKPVLGWDEYYQRDAERG